MAVKQIEIVEALRLLTRAVTERNDAAMIMHAGYAEALLAKFKPSTPRTAKIEQETKIIDGKTYYGSMVNYTTGARMGWCSFKDSGKFKKSKAILALIAARARGELVSPVDWLPVYIAKAQEIRPQLDAIPENAHSEAWIEDRQWEREREHLEQFNRKEAA